MAIKKIITGGCSFSTVGKGNCTTWPCVMQDIYPHISFRHTAFMAQGQELIQKKVSLAVIEELENFENYEIAVLVMWSGTYRKCFYVNNEHFIKNLEDTWLKNNRFGIVPQLLDLYNNIPQQEQKTHKGSKFNLFLNYKKGWYSFNPAHDTNDSKFVEEYTKTFIDELPSTITSIENIIMLQNLCTIKKIKLYHSFYMSETYNDIVIHKDNSNINYLYKQLDKDSIVSTIGIFDYLKSYNDESYFDLDKIHPSRKGHEKWTKEILIPKLTERGFFNGST